MDPEDIRNSFYMVSQTITNLSITVALSSASFCLFDIINKSTMNSLKILRLQVDTDDDHNLYMDSGEQHPMDIQWRRQYSSLTSVHLIIGRWLSEGQTAILTAIVASGFLWWCLDLNILTVEVHTCRSFQITRALLPECIWTSGDLKGQRE
jgi:hypothetical protein